MADLPTVPGEPAYGEVYVIRENVRGNIAYALIAILGAVVVGIAVGAMVLGWTQVEGASAALVGPVVGLLGTCLGFYFGERAQSRK